MYTALKYVCMHLFDLSLLICIQNFLQTALADLDMFKDKSIVRFAEMYRTQRTQPTVEDDSLSFEEPSGSDVPVSLSFR